MSYNVMETEDNMNEIKVTFSEIYGAEALFVQMKVEISTGDVYFVDFDSPAQVESCMWQMQEYLRKRRTVWRDERPMSAEPE